MSLKERVYSILIVSYSERFSSSFNELIPQSRYNPVHTVTSTSSAKRVLAGNTFDFVVINSPLSDDTDTRFAIDISNSKQTIVLLLTKNDIYADIHDKVAEYGVFTLPKPTSKSALLQALNWMESARELLKQSEKTSLSIEEKMAEIRLVNKAKWLLISQLNMSEPEAHHYIEKQAMNQCLPKKHIAEDIIKTYAI